MSTLKKTASKLKFDGMTFLHWSKATEENSFLKESASVNGIKYFKLRDGVSVEITEDDQDAGLVDSTFTLPTADEIEKLEKKDLVVDEAGELKAVESKPAIIPHASGKKMKAQYLNPKTGNYVSYVRWLQIKGK
jgi:hypothetical protein